MTGPRDAVPPPSYQMSLEEYDQKTTRAIQLSSSTTTILIDDDGWPIYNEAAFEAVAGSSSVSPPASTSAGIVTAETSRNERRGRQSFVKVPTSPHLMKKTRSSERRGRNPRHDDEYPSEHRPVTPPPPFTATGPSLDGPPFEEVVRMSYDESESQAASPLEPAYSPPARSPPPLPQQVLQPVEPLRLPPNRYRHSDSHIQTSSNPLPLPYRRPSPTSSDVRPIPNPTSTITRVEFDHRMAYSSSGGVGDHAAIQAGATAFYNHAVASQLNATNPTTSAPTQPSFMESRVSSPYSSGFPSTMLQPQHAMSAISLHDQYASQAPNLRFNTPAASPPLPPQPQSTLPGVGYAGLPSGAARGPLPQVPASSVPSSHTRW